MADSVDKTIPSDTENSCFELLVKEKEEGIKGWLTVLGASLVYLSTFGIINSFGFFQELYQNTYLKTTPASTISFIGTIQILLMNLLAAPAGSLFDYYGLKYLYIFSGIGTSGGLVLLSISQPTVLWQLFLIQGVLLGLAIAFGAQPALVVVGHHFFRRRALVMGIVAAAGSVGGVCFPLIFARLTPMIGFAWSVRLVALVILTCYIVALCISSTKSIQQPLSKLSELLDFRGFLDSRYSVLALGAFVTMLGQFVPYYYITSYCVAANPSSPAKVFLLPAMNAASIVGRILGGLAADDTGPANIVYPMTLLSGIQCLAMWLVTSDPGVLLAFASLYGFCSGVFIAVLPVIVAQISPECKLGGRIGAFYSVLAIAQLVGSPIAGALIRDVGDGVGEGRAYMGLIVFAVSVVDRVIL
ncbi:MFS general substrate transporter [Westerdykella ornata]|uniref:MFS general substrate transporter n=1 Tax=Westerdykella ornata TaxID=318751 RepID=A0A6A6JBD8_WESOR|nr:MFS general substrate transporter [Westerdykella ornata]KAF2273514.1 MFS general substrate transporter [Westerdykella ornata]